MNKQCTKCKNSYPETEEYFYNQKTITKKKGEFYALSSWCRVCIKEKNKKYGNNNKEKRSENFKNWYKENKERENERVKEWRDNNKEHIADYFKDYQQTDEFKERSYLYGKEREKINHDISEIEWNNCKAYFDFRCAYCNMPEELHRELVGQQLHKEHVIWNGENDLSNCAPSCRNCNSQKWKHPMETWYIKQKFFNEGNFIKIMKWLNEDHKAFIKTKKKKESCNERNI